MYNLISTYTSVSPSPQNIVVGLKRESTMTSLRCSLLGSHLCFQCKIVSLIKSTSRNGLRKQNEIWSWFPRRIPCRLPCPHGEKGPSQCQTLLLSVGQTSGLQLQCQALLSSVGQTSGLQLHVLCMTGQKLHQHVLMAPSSRELDINMF